MLKGRTHDQSVLGQVFKEALRIGVVEVEVEATGWGK